MDTDIFAAPKNIIEHWGPSIGDLKCTDSPYVVHFNHSLGLQYISTPRPRGWGGAALIVNQDRFKLEKLNINISHNLEVVLSVTPIQTGITHHCAGSDKSRTGLYQMRISISLGAGL